VVGGGWFRVVSILLGPEGTSPRGVVVLGSGLSGRNKLPWTGWLSGVGVCVVGVGGLGCLLRIV
jgi:hypothetical protein